MYILKGKIMILLNDIEFYFTKKVEMMMKKGKSNCEKKKGNRSIQK